MLFIVQVAGAPGQAVSPPLIAAPTPSTAEGGGLGDSLAIAVGLATGMVYVLLIDLPHLDGTKQGV